MESISTIIITIIIIIIITSISTSIIVLFLVLYSPPKNSRHLVARNHNIQVANLLKNALHSQTLISE